MPLVEYRCADCASVFERLVPSTAGADRADCPSCGQPTGKRLLSLFASQVRGSDGASTAASASTGGCCGGGACGCGH